MKCQQCDRPAWYEYQNGGRLCLHCGRLLADINFRDQLMNMAGANQALDDMDAVSGINLGGGRFPVAALAMAIRGPVTQNNITISGSSVGVINTGDLAKINAVITITEGSDAEPLGLAIQQLTQAVLDSNQVASETKRELVDLISALSEQVTQRRSKSVMAMILKGIDERVKSVNAIWSLYDHVAKLVESLQQAGS